MTQGYRRAGCGTRIAGRASVILRSSAFGRAPQDPQQRAGLADCEQSADGRMLLSGGHVMRSKDRMQDILARFPGPVTLRPTLKKWSLLLSGCYAGIALGFSGIATGIGPIWLAWFVIALFSVFTVLIVVAPRASSLRLDEEGFEMTALFRRYSIRWRDVANFETTVLPLAVWKNVVFDDASATKRTNINTMRRLYLRLNAALLGGRNTMLPDTY